MIKYQAAKTGTGDYGEYKGLEAMMLFLHSKVSAQGGVRLKKGYGNETGPVLQRFEAFKRVRAFLNKASAGDKITIFPDTGPFNWTVRAANYDPLPDSFTAGVNSIDAIASAVYTQFNDKYGITNLGICVSKPGEHGACNAIDIGVSKPKSADAIHSAILEIGNFLRIKMLSDMQGEPNGLPVNGVIVMEQVCSREDTSWHYYSGIAHVSHVHVSGWPNLVPGWV
jgi:hypothetical protein